MSYATYKNLGVNKDSKIEKYNTGNNENTDKQSNNGLPNNPNVIEITSLEQRSTMINKYQICVIDLYSPTCNPCKSIAPKFNELATKFKDQSSYAFAKQNVMNGQVPFDPSYGITVVPAFMFYKNGKYYKNLNLTGADIKNVEENLKVLINS
jgi:thioredoxin 1